MYGSCVGSGERTEDAPVDLRRAGHVYASTELAAEMLAHSYHEMHGQGCTLLRYGIPYGPRMRGALVGRKVGVGGTSFAGGVRHHLDWLAETRAPGKGQRARSGENNPG